MDIGHMKDVELKSSLSQLIVGSKLPRVKLVQRVLSVVASTHWPMSRYSKCARSRCRGLLSAQSGKLPDRS